MRGNGWNPTRRNKNIGTKKSGYSQNNELVISDRWSEDRVFWERLVSPVIYPIDIRGHQITLLIEPPRAGFFHSATPQDIERMFHLFPQAHVEEIEVVVLRQPKQKELILKPVWGRFIYYADLGKYSGPGIYLESLKMGDVLKWDKKLTPFYQLALEMLRSDGHEIETTKRHHLIHTTAHSVRNTQLFRTLPHEMGHAVDYLLHAEIPASQASSESESDYIYNKFKAKPSLDKEAFANRYAREFNDKNRATGKIPYEPIFDAKKMKSFGIKPEWFDFNL